MSKERLQLNLRLDGHKELYEAVKAAAAEQDTSVNQWVIDALKAKLGWVDEQTPVAPTRDVLEERLAELQGTLEERLRLRLAEMETRLVEVEQQLGEFAA